MNSLFEALSAVVILVVLGQVIHIVSDRWANRSVDTPSRAATPSDTATKSDRARFDCRSIRTACRAEYTGSFIGSPTGTWPESNLGGAYPILMDVKATNLAPGQIHVFGRVIDDRCVAGSVVWIYDDADCRTGLILDDGTFHIGLERRTPVDIALTVTVTDSEGNSSAPAMVLVPGL